MGGDNGAGGLVQSEGIEVCWADGDDYADGMVYTVGCVGSDADKAKAVRLAIDGCYRPAAMDGHWDLDDEGNSTGEWRLYFYRDEGGSEQ